MEKKSLLLTLVRLSLIVLWLPVAVDKLWNLSGFHSTLLRQPFPNAWADVLFWLLPVLELLAAVLIAWPQKTSLRGMRPASASRSNLLPAYHPLRISLWLSSTLLLGFTLFILFGVLGWYEKRSCGCGSVISGLSWEQHLWFNVAFLLLSIAGLWLTWPTGSRGKNPSPNSLSFRRQQGSPHHALSKHTSGTIFSNRHFPRKFALFRRRAVCISLPCLYIVQHAITWGICGARGRNLHVTGRNNTTAYEKPLYFNQTFFWGAFFPTAKQKPIL